MCLKTYLFKLPCQEGFGSGIQGYGSADPDLKEIFMDLQQFFTYCRSPPRFPTPPPFQIPSADAHRGQTPVKTTT